MGVYERIVDGSIQPANEGLSAFDQLPSPDTKRWVVRRKAEVVAAIRAGVLSRTDACTRYQLSNEELRLWERAIDAVGTPGLRVTRVQIYRDVFEKRH